MSYILTKTTRYILYISVFLIPFDRFFDLPTVDDKGIKPYRIALAIALLTSILVALKVDKRIRRIIVYLTLPYFIALLIAAFNAAFYQASLEYALHQLMLLSMGFAIFYLIINSIRKLDDLVALFWILPLSFVASSSVWFMTSPLDSISRLSGFLHNANHFAYLAALSILLIVTYITNSRPHVYMQISALGLIVLACGLMLLTGSRAAPISLTAALSYIFVRKGIQNSKNLKVSLIYAAFIVPTSALFIILFFDSVYMEAVRVRFDIDQVSTGSGRFDIWRAAWLALGDHLFMGMGLGQYRFQHFDYVDQLSGNAYSTIVEHEFGLHNEFLVLLVEAGLIGLFIYIIGYYCLWKVIGNPTRATSKGLQLAHIIQVIFIYNTVFSLSQTMYVFLYHWVVLGSCVAYANIVSNECRTQFYVVRPSKASQW